MAAKKNIFRQESLDRIESPEKLDQYIKVSRPTTWVVLAGLLIVTLGALIWSFSGTLPEIMQTRGVTMTGNQVSLFVEPANLELVKTGDAVEITLPDQSKVSGTVSEVGKIPLSAVDLAEEINEQWIVEQISTDLYTYEILVTTDENIPAGLIVDGDVTVREIHPIEYLLN